MRNLEAESTRGRAESTGAGVKLKTVAAIRNLQQNVFILY